VTTKEEIGQWFDYGVKETATHMIVVCDTFSHDDYPAYVHTLSEFWERYKYYDNQNMQRIMEVYDLGADKAEQMREHRCRRTPARTTAE
jgi:hypothetical protein